jgi:hypothetical protein
MFLFYDLPNMVTFTKFAHNVHAKLLESRSAGSIFERGDIYNGGLSPLHFKTGKYSRLLVKLQGTHLYTLLKVCRNV